MPSTRHDKAVTDEQRQAPPASPELLAPSDVLDRTEAKDRRKLGTGSGRRSDEKEGQIFETITGLMGKLDSAAAIAREAECSPETVRKVIRKARATLASRAEFYADTHATAAVIAAAQGDAKPAQWALERIAEGEDRVIDAPKEPTKGAGNTGPVFNFGFKIGGMGTSPASALPAVEGVVLDATEKA